MGGTMAKRDTGYPKTNKQPRPEPNEITEMWRDYRHEMQERARERLAIRQVEIAALAEMGYRVRALTEYQFRVNERLDLFPTRRRYHDIKTQARGRYQNPQAICRTVLGVPQLKGWDNGEGAEHQRLDGAVQHLSESDHQRHR
jgi:hypothetical protein